MPAQSHKTNKETPALLIEDLTFSYDRHPVIEAVNFRIEKGDVAAIIGPNGSGKTTLLKLILGLLEGQTGQIALFGEHIHNVRDRVGYVPQNFTFDRRFPITVREFMHLAAHRNCPPGRIETKIEEVGLSPSVLDEHLGNLSGGQLQRTLIAQAILNNPDVLFLDEPSTGIDVHGEAVFYNILKHLNEEHGTTIVIVSHEVSVISKVVDKIICLNRKLLCAGHPRDVLSEKTMAELFGKGTKIYQHGHHHRPENT